MPCCGLHALRPLVRARRRDRVRLRRLSYLAVARQSCASGGKLASVESGHRVSARFHKVVGAVLAGGQSARMGRDKGTLVVTRGDGAAETLGARAVRVLREAGCDDVVCLGHGRGVPDDVARVADVADLGPVGGVLALVRGVPADVYCVMPVDMPGLEGVHLRTLIDALASADASARVAVFARGGVIEPLPFAMRKSACAVVEERVGAGVRKIVSLLEATGVVTVAITDHAVIRNVNTLADFEENPRLAEDR